MHISLINYFLTYHGSMVYVYEDNRWNFLKKTYGFIIRTVKSGRSIKQD